MSVTPERGGIGPSTTLPTYRVALGFDFGYARIGVAIGEAITGTARPLRTLPTRQQRPDWDAIARCIADWQPDVLVVGVPRHADESASATTKAALRFSRQLRERFTLPVLTIDERLSSWEAQQRSFEEVPPGQRRGGTEALDAAAAAVILESWFNQQRSLASCLTPNS